MGSKNGAPASHTSERKPRSVPPWSVMPASLGEERHSRSLRGLQPCESRVNEIVSDAISACQTGTGHVNTHSKYRDTTNIMKSFHGRRERLRSRFVESSHGNIPPL
jgi:hypothetical protein